MIVTFTIPGRLPGLNELIAAINRHRHVGATLKKSTTELCAMYVVAGRVPKFSGAVSVKFEWIEPDRRRDLDNISAGAKFILDAMVETGRLQNDTRKCVQAIVHRFPEPDPKNPRVEVTVWQDGAAA
ncbi:MAG TPA: hypothetical protein VFN81_08675 [Sphingomicrobium sp.]|nr:hypothetical protein [Sphingomicrobium sp.]